MNRRRAIMSKVSGFAAATLITGVVNAAAIPALIASGGISGWTSLAVGQSVGAIAAVAIGFGWAVSGAATVAMMSTAEAADALRRSVAIRALLAIPVLAVAAAVGWTAVRGGSWNASAAAVAYGLNGLTAAWWFIGIRSPRGMIVRETVPKSTGVVLGVVVAAATGQLLWFPLGLALGCLAAAALAVQGLPGRHWFMRADFIGVRAELRSQAPAALTSAVSTAYLNVPMIVVSTMVPQQLAAFAITDRLFRLASVGVSPLVQTLQGWIPHPDPQELTRRIPRGLQAAALLAGVASVGFAVVSAVAGPLISAGTVEVEPASVIAFACTLFFVVVSQISGLSCLVALGRVSDVARSAVLGAVVGVPVVLVGTLLVGAPGAAAGQAMAEGAVTSYQLLRVRRLLRRRRADRTVPALSTVIDSTRTGDPL